MSDNPSETNSRRRAFFSRMVGEVVAVADEWRDIPHYRLSDLVDYPPEKLAKLRPVVRAGCEIRLEDGQVWGTAPKAAEPVPLFAATDENTLVFNRFTGEHSIGDVAAQLAASCEGDADQAFELTRELFLNLVRAGVCIPNNDPE